MEKITKHVVILEVLFLKKKKRFRSHSIVNLLTCVNTECFW